MYAFVQIIKLNPISVNNYETNLSAQITFFFTFPSVLIQAEIGSLTKHHSIKGAVSTIL